MYIFELIARKLKEKNAPRLNPPEVEQNIVNDEILENKCEHTFFPIDSTGETLACSKCGQLIKNTALSAKPKNPFS